ncbi:MAG: hypothetical protein ACP5OG_04785 [Candidatus Nanoarchaeia archaeon]
MNKRGFEMIWSTAVTLIIALVVLAFLFYFFLSTSGNFKDRINQFLKKSNVDEISQSCNLMAETSQVYSYCCEPKELRYFEGKTLKKEKLTCSEISKLNIGKDITQIDCSGVC